MQKIGKKIIRYDETISTNEDGKRLAAQGAEDGTVIIANRQTSGKGRMGRTWESSNGEGIFLSVILKPTITINEAQLLTLVAAVSVHATIEKVVGVKPSIKWPNDILLNNKKICGILAELHSIPDNIYYIVCGIGINVNNQSFAMDMRFPATSLYLETGRKHDMHALTQALLREMDGWYTDYPENKSELLHVYKQNCMSLHREVTVTHSTGQYDGLVIDIMEDGGLLIENRDKERHTVYAGEVSIR